jgi:hypothetical protein
VGKDADLVIWNMDPLSTYARAEKVYIDGDLFFDSSLPGFGTPHFNGAMHDARRIWFRRRWRGWRTNEQLLRKASLLFLRCLFAVICSGECFLRNEAWRSTLAITGGKLLTVSHGTIENGVLLIVDGKITAVGAAGKVTVPKDATVVDAHGLTVYPGLIDPDTTLGLTEVGSDENSNDLSEPSDEIMPHMHVADAFHAETELIPVARLNGVTNAVVAPGTDDSVAGQDIFIQLAGKRNREAMILGRDVALAMNYGADQRRRRRARQFAVSVNAHGADYAASPEPAGCAAL